MNPELHVWPSMEQYARARECSWCGAGVGEDCVWAQRSPGKRYHASRWSAGNRHYMRDIDAAPLTEDRVPGVCYCTLDPCPMVTP